MNEAIKIPEEFVIKFKNKILKLTLNKLKKIKITKKFIKIILDLINLETYRNFEVIVTEDDNTLGTFIKKLNYNLIHVSKKI